MSARQPHPLETWTRGTFGDDFAEFVLYGLFNEWNGGGDCEDLTTVEAVDGAGRKRRMTLAVQNRWDERWGLKPLVLAALLKQLVERPKLKARLDFSLPRVLAELGWPDIPASRRAVQDAATFYRVCSYRTTTAYEGGASRRSVLEGSGLICSSTFRNADTPQCDQLGDRGISMTPKGRKKKGPRPVWHSGDYLVGSLERAIEAIGFDRAWNEKEKRELGTVQFRRRDGGALEVELG